jgi:hypothetical protein
VINKKERLSFLNRSQPNHESNPKQEGHQNLTPAKSLAHLRSLRMEDIGSLTEGADAGHFFKCRRRTDSSHRTIDQLFDQAFIAFENGGGSFPPWRTRIQ